MLAVGPRRVSTWLVLSSAYQPQCCKPYFRAEISRISRAAFRNGSGRPVSPLGRKTALADFIRRATLARRSFSPNPTYHDHLRCKGLAIDNGFHAASARRVTIQ